MSRALKLKRPVSITVCLTFCALILSACSALNALIGGANIKRPEVSFVDAKLSKLSFDTADFVFDLKIQNPNSVGVKLAGFDYDFMINNNSFIKGDQQKELEIKAQGEETIQFPLSLTFIDLYQTFQSLKDQGESSYLINFGFSFNLPVLGVVRVPVSKEGKFPLLKLPKISLETFKLKGINISGADLVLTLRLKNPNIFSMILENMQYKLDVNGSKWVSGNMASNVQVKENDESLVEIPISLNFLEVGRSVYQLVNSDRELNYQFGGSLDLMTSLPILGKVDLPFSLSGQTKLLK